MTGCDDQRTGIDPMEVVQVRSEAKSLNRPIDVLLDVRRRIRDRAVSTI